MSGQIPIPPSPARQSTSQYVPKRDRKVYRKKQAYQARKTYKASSYRTRAGVAKQAPSKLALKVSDCAMRYMATLANPFQAEPGACVPCDLFPLPSQKIRVFTRGTFQLGTTGFGFIAAAPTAANDAGCCTFTTSTSVLGSATAFSAATNTGSAQFSQLPYTVAQVLANNGAAIQCRAVALGLRVRYAGAESTRSGTVVSYEDQDHQGVIASGSTFLGLQQYPSATVARPSGDGTWDGEVCSSGPCTPVELEFVSLAYPNTSTGLLANAAYLCIGIKGNAGDSYDFEVFEHIEYIGTNVTAKTPSNADTDQYGKIIQASKEIANVRPLTPELAPSLFERFANKVSESLPQLIGMGAGAVRAAFGDPTGYAQLLGGAASMIMNTPVSQQPRLLRGQTQLMKQITA